MFFILSFVLIYIIIDYFFGLPLMKYSLKFHRYELNRRYSKLLTNTLDDISLYADLHNTEFVTSNEENKRLYSVGSFNEKIICLTTPFLDTIRFKTQKDEDFCNAVSVFITMEVIKNSKGGHINETIFEINKKILHYILLFFGFFITLIAKLFKIIPTFGKDLHNIIILIKNGTFKIFEMMQNTVFIFSKIFLLSFTFQRNLDKKTAKILGGETVAFALRLVENHRYRGFQIKGMHRRVKKIEKIQKKEGILIKDYEFLYVSGVCIFLTGALFFTSLHTQIIQNATKFYTTTTFQQIKLDIIKKISIPKLSERIWRNW